jgi:hypothetical protein
MQRVLRIESNHRTDPDRRPDRWPIRPPGRALERPWEIDLSRATPSQLGPILGELYAFRDQILVLDGVDAIPPAARATPHREYDLGAMRTADDLAEEASTITRVLERLAAIDDGDATLLDHTLVVWCERGDLSPSRRGPLRRPIVLAGGAPGLRMGRYLYRPAVMSDGITPGRGLLLSLR